MYSPNKKKDCNGLNNINYYIIAIYLSHIKHIRIYKCNIYGILYNQYKPG
jgi:hypothetical protein